MTSVHSPDDVRIFEKECRTLAAAGYDVSLIAVSDKAWTCAGVQHIPVKSGHSDSRLQRMIVGVWHVYRAAVLTDADVYHVHDPELLSVALLLKARGKRVLYDAHEDLPAAILTKDWISRPLRPLVSRVISVVEGTAAGFLDMVLAATPSIARRFPPSRTTLVQNFPHASELFDPMAAPIALREPIVAYVGGVSKIRGAREMLEGVNAVASELGARLLIAGPLEPPDLDDQLSGVAGFDRVTWLGVRSRRDVRDLLANAVIGLILFQPAPNHVAAQPNKLFEYMAAGIPVVASDFPLWRDLIESTQSGLVVDPGDPEAIARAISFLLRNRAEAEAMGARGREAVRTSFSWEPQGKSLVAAYRSILSS